MPTSSVALTPDTVVVVPFPYSGRLAEKRRPALVVSGPEVGDAGLLRIGMITGARNPAVPGDVPITDLQNAGLSVDSKIRPLKIACIEPPRVLRRIGALAPDEAATVYENVRGLIGPR